MMQEYEKNLDVIIKRNSEYIEELKKEKMKLENRIKNTTNADIINAINISLRRLDYTINDLLKESLFYRNPIQEDIDYRVEYISSKSFLLDFYNCLPEDLPLRFHGSPIQRVKQIIESGEISSSVDRVGFETSTNNVSNQISTHDKSLFHKSILYYTDLTIIYKPLGCIFVLIDPNNSKIIDYGICSMQNFNLKENQEKLFGIITSPESAVLVREWCNQNGIDGNKVFDYEQFIAYMKSKKL